MVAKKIAVFFALDAWFHTSNRPTAQVIRAQAAIKNVAAPAPSRSDQRSDIRHLRFFTMSGDVGLCLSASPNTRHLTVRPELGLS